MSATIAVDLLREYPWLVVLVGIVARLARAWQHQLSWPEYRAAHRFKRGVFPLADRVAGGVMLWVSDKGGRDDAEYQFTADGSVRDVVRDLRAAGASLHLINSLKRRSTDFSDGDVTGDRYSAAHVVWTRDEAGEQVEVYTFRNYDGTMDVYAHTEASVDNPIAHLTGGQRDGDAYDVLPNVDGTREA
jgi:hypothetical protein